MSIKNPFIVNPLYTRVVLRWSSEVRGHPWWHFHQAKFGAYAPKLLDQNLGKYPDGVPFQFHLHFVAHMSLTQTNSPRNTPNVNQFYTQVIFGRSTPSEGSSMIMTFSKPKKGTHAPNFGSKKWASEFFFFQGRKFWSKKAPNFGAFGFRILACGKHTNILLSVQCCKISKCSVMADSCMVGLVSSRAITNVWTPTWSEQLYPTILSPLSVMTTYVVTSSSQIVPTSLKKVSQFGACQIPTKIKVKPDLVHGSQILDQNFRR